VTRSGEQFGKQLAAAVLRAVYSFVVTFALLKLINLVVPIRPSANGTQRSLDFTEHGEEAYTPTTAYAMPQKSEETAALESNAQV